MEITTDIDYILGRIELHNLKLPKGMMVNWINETRDTGSTAIFLQNDAVAVLNRNVYDLSFELSCALYVDPTKRGKGLGRKLVLESLRLTEGRSIQFHPWDNNSGTFFKRLYLEGALGQNNFPSGILKLLLTDPKL